MGGLATVVHEAVNEAVNAATPVAVIVDLRTIAPRDRRALIFGRFDALQPGQAWQLANDLDPQPLRFQIEDRAFGEFEWTVLESDPAVWRMQITRIGIQTKPGATDSCCSGGACCG